MADGGEGTAEALIYATAGTWQAMDGCAPFGHPGPISFAVLGDGVTVVIESARIVGLTQVPIELRNPLNITSLGMGKAIQHALNQGYRKFIIGLGGTACNDGGLGMLHALGATFLDRQGKQLPTFPHALAQLAHVDLTTLDFRKPNFSSLLMYPIPC